MSRLHAVAGGDKVCHAAAAAAMTLSSTREGVSPQTAMHTHIMQTVHQLERGRHMWRGLTEALLAEQGSCRGQWLQVGSCMPARLCTSGLS